MAVIFIADNRHHAQRSEEVARYLTSRDHEVKVFDDGRAAEQAIRAQPPDVLVCALMLRGVDAYGLAEAMNEQPHRGGRTILLTQLGSSGEPVRHWPGPFWSYLMPGCCAWQVVLAVEQALECAADLG